MAIQQSYRLNASATVFAFNHKVTDSNNLTVTQLDDDGTVTLLGEGVDYTVAGVGNDSVAVSVTYAAASGINDASLLIALNDTAGARLTDFSSLGSVTPEAINEEFDNTYLGTQINTTNIDSNTTDTATNTANIATNTADIATNVADIDDLELDALQRPSAGSPYNANGEVIDNVAEPVDGNDAATRNYVDTQVSGAGTVPSPTAPDVFRVLTATAVGAFGWLQGVLRVSTATIKTFIFRDAGETDQAEVGFDGDVSASVGVTILRNKVTGQWLGLKNNSLFRFHDGVTERRIWGEHDQGTGTGMDADTVDGIEGSEIATIGCGGSSDTGGAQVTVGNHRTIHNTANVTYLVAAGFGVSANFQIRHTGSTGVFQIRVPDGEAVTDYLFSAFRRGSGTVFIEPDPGNETDTWKISCFNLAGAAISSGLEFYAIKA